MLYSFWWKKNLRDRRSSRPNIVVCNKLSLTNLLHNVCMCTVWECLFLISSAFLQVVLLSVKRTILLLLFVIKMSVVLLKNFESYCNWFFSHKSLIVFWGYFLSWEDMHIEIQQEYELRKLSGALTVDWQGSTSASKWVILNYISSYFSFICKI